MWFNKLKTKPKMDIYSRVNKQENMYSKEGVLGLDFFT